MLTRLRNVRLSTVFYAVIALIVLGPMLGRGYILTLDMSWMPKLAMPDTLDNTYLFRVLLHVLDLALPSWFIQKIILFLILFLSGLGMHKLVAATERRAKVQFVSRYHLYFAGLLYMINPYTYTRFMTGQYLVLLGYALMPFFVRAFLRFIERPGPWTIARAVFWAFLIGIVSIHAIGMLVFVGLVGIGFGVWFYGLKDRRFLKMLLGYGAVGSGLFLLLSSFWLVPVVLGKSEISHTIDGFANTDRQVFATLGSGQLGSLLKVAGLQGFWADAHNLYQPIRILGAIQLLALPLLLGVVGYGAVHGLRGRVRLTNFFLIVTLGAMVLAVGETGILAPFNRFLTDHLPLFSGYREPQKFTGLVVLGYAWLGSQGVRSLLLDRKKESSSLKKLEHSWALGICLILPLLYTPVMLWGFHGQLKPRQYPPEWATLNTRLNNDNSDFKVLFLPWHQYMSFNFARRIISNPAANYFDKPMIVSNNPELGSLKDTKPSAENAYIEKQVLSYTGGPDLPARLLKAKIKYVILAKELDYAQFKGIESQNGIKILEDTDSYTLYLNEAMK